jgi:steroid delta-isomerase-like uncharacterized protein
VEIPGVIRTYVETFSRSGLDAWVDTFAPGATYRDPSTIQPEQRQALKERFTAFFATFPDARFETTALDPISEELWVWRWVLHGTNAGPYRGQQPTGRAVTVPGCEFIETRGGKVYQVEGYFDRLTMLAQLGLAPSPPAPSATP